MKKKKRELIEILLDNITPSDWPEHLLYAAQDKSSISTGKSTLWFYQSKPVLSKVNFNEWNSVAPSEYDDLLKDIELCKHWDKAIVTRDEFVKRWNERIHSETNTTTPPAQQELHTEETKPIQQENKATDTQINKIITERGNNYGRFEDGAEIMQQFKHIAHTSRGWERMKPNQREAMDMILHKIGRILNGRPDYADSWIDIEGYSKLISDWLKGESK